MDFEEIPKPPEHVVRYAMGLVSGPCIAMIVLGFAVRVSEPPVLFVASIGIAALLFLVTEELLLEAHEAQEHSAHEEHIWWVDMFFFLGFLLSFLMDKLLDTD